MNQIHKYELEIYTTEPRLPIGAKILDISYDGTTFVLWVIADAALEHEERTIIAFQTGDEIVNPKRLDYLKTVCSEKGVYHFFEKI